ncbi:hypothetical protein KM043_004025 [Ampulex compressa]|nr:hypothetical protein KM043_004025 [Ampulex compressa]
MRDETLELASTSTSSKCASKTSTSPLVVGAAHLGPSTLGSHSLRPVLAEALTAPLALQGNPVALRSRRLAVGRGLRRDGSVVPALWETCVAPEPPPKLHLPRQRAKLESFPTASSARGERRKNASVASSTDEGREKEVKKQGEKPVLIGIEGRSRLVQGERLAEKKRPVDTRDIEKDIEGSAGRRRKWEEVGVTDPRRSKEGSRKVRGSVEGQRGVVSKGGRRRGRGRRKEEGGRSKEEGGRASRSRRRWRGARRLAGVAAIGVPARGAGGKLRVEWLASNSKNKASARATSALDRSTLGAEGCSPGVEWPRMTINNGRQPASRLAASRARLGSRGRHHRKVADGQCVFDSEEARPTSGISFPTTILPRV